MTNFPKDFLFGSATSAHQIEGGNINSDWYAWEKAGNIEGNQTSLIAADSWNKWKEDIELLKNTGQNAYRFSIEWAKIEPKQGKFDKIAIEHYRQILLELKRNNIKSMVTLWHFTLPVWLKNGFDNSKAPELFANFAKVAVENYGELVDLWATLNEPNVYVLKGYIQGNWYPAKKKTLLGIKVYRNLIKAHNLAYDAMKSVKKEVVCGTVINQAFFEPASNSFLNKKICDIARYISYEYFIKRIIKKCDFLGINYYQRFILQPIKTVQYDINNNSEGLYLIIRQNVKWKKPLFITENGVAGENDEIRQKYLEKVFYWLGKALDDNLPIKGYFYWSLLDNFEWASAYAIHFGLHTIDRKPKNSALVYKKLISENILENKNKI